MTDTEKQKEGELPEGADVEQTRDKVEGALEKGNPMDKMIFAGERPVIELKLRRTSRNEPGALLVNWISGLRKKDWYISFFTQGKKEPVTIKLVPGSYVTAKTLGFDPARTSYNYVVHPKTD